MKLIKNNNHFMNDLYNIMNNPTFKVFYNKYCDNWDNINTVIMYFKLFEIIEISFYKNFNRTITKKEILYILNNIIKNTLFRKIIVDNYQLFKNSQSNQLTISNIKCLTF